MWPFPGSAKDSSSFFFNKFAEEISGSFREMIIAPHEKSGENFSNELASFERAIKNKPTEKDLPRISQDLAVAAKRFGQGQKQAIEKTINDLDKSLRSMVEIIDHSNHNTEVTISAFHSSVRKLNRLAEAHPDDPLTAELTSEIEELTKAMHRHHETNKLLTQKYQAELATMHERLSGNRETANLDPLTGLSNRAGHEYYLKGISSKATPNSPYALALMDLTGFQKINDAYGHGTGDAALTYFAEALKQTFGSAAHLCRLGGDEFTVISHENSATLAQTVLRFKQRLESGPITLAGKPCKLGINFSCVEIDGDLPYSGIMREADERLYEAKHATATPAAA